MSECFLKGTLPTEVFALQNLIHFNVLNSEGLTGILPSEIGMSSTLQILQLGGNRFEGALPEELWQLTELLELDLYKCKFAGNLSPGIGKMSKLQNLFLDGNTFTGSLPAEFYNLNVSYAIFFSNLFSGTISPNIANMFESIVEIDFGENKFSGPLPTELGDLINANHLWFESNAFTGTLPSEIGGLRDLQTLSIYNNPGLGGTIPLTFLNAVSLQDVRLENTNVEGVEEAFCNPVRDTPIDSISADCSVEVECSCCTTCCINGAQCREVQGK